MTGSDDIVSNDCTYEKVCQHPDLICCFPQDMNAMEDVPDIYVNCDRYLKTDWLFTVLWMGYLFIYIFYFKNN